MKRAQIAGISLIERKGNEIINLVAIRLADGNTLLRNVKQFATDLDGSHRLQGVDTSFLTSVKHPAIAKACSKLANATISGDWQPYKKGDAYTVTETMSVITDSTHPEYGKVKVGDKRIHTSDGNVITGFLTLVPSMEQLMVEESAEQFAMLNAQAMNLFGSSSSSSSKPANDVLPEFDDTLVAESIGANATE
jgi:hypothetical protein